MPKKENLFSGASTHQQSSIPIDQALVSAAGPTVALVDNQKYEAGSERGKKVGVPIQGVDSPTFDTLPIPMDWCERLRPYYRNCPDCQRPLGRGKSKYGLAWHKGCH